MTVTLMIRHRQKLIYGATLVPSRTRTLFLMCSRTPQPRGVGRRIPRATWSGLSGRRNFQPLHPSSPIVALLRVLVPAVVPVCPAFVALAAPPLPTACRSGLGLRACRLLSGLCLLVCHLISIWPRRLGPLASERRHHRRPATPPAAASWTHHAPKRSAAAAHCLARAAVSARVTSQRPPPQRVPTPRRTPPQQRPRREPPTRA